MKRQPGQPGPAQTRPAQTHPVKHAVPAQQTAARPKLAPVKQPAAKPKEPSPKPKEKPLVFTDEDLKKFHEGEPASAVRPSTLPPPATDPLKSFKDKAEHDKWRQTRAAELQKTVTDLEAHLKFLQEKRLSIQNPLVPRPADPSGQADSDEGLNGGERLAKNDEEMRDTQKSLEAARQALASFLQANPE